MSGDVEISLCQCDDICRSCISSYKSKFLKMLTRIESGRLPLLNLLGFLIMRGRLKSKAGSGGVDACLGIGDGERGVDVPRGGVPRGELMGDGSFEKLVLVGLEGESGGGGASEPLLDLDRTLSRSRLRNGSGS